MEKVFIRALTSRYSSAECLERIRKTMKITAICEIFTSWLRPKLGVTLGSSMKPWAESLPGWPTTDSRTTRVTVWSCILNLLLWLRHIQKRFKVWISQDYVVCKITSLPVLRSSGLVCYYKTNKSVKIEVCWIRCYAVHLVWHIIL